MSEVVLNSMADDEATPGCSGSEDVNRVASSGDPKEKRSTDECEEPPAKKAKLAQRLGGILCCVVCLDCPSCAIYQCSNGHLMCAGCYTHLLADARLRDEEAKCPTCRVEFSKLSTSRNLAVEKALSELPAACRFCNGEFPRNHVPFHEETECSERLSGCKYAQIGCLWLGPHHEVMEHERGCIHPHRTGAEIMESLEAMHKTQQEDRKLVDCIFDFMSYEKITFNDLQLRPYRTDEYVHKLFYETGRFSAFFQQWVVKARIHTNNTKVHPSEMTDRKLMYQLSLKTNSKPTYPIIVHWMVVRGPFGDMKVAPMIYTFEFTENENDSAFVELPLCDSSECNRLLAAKVINFRLIMFIVSR